MPSLELSFGKNQLKYSESRENIIIMDNRTSMKSSQNNRSSMKSLHAPAANQRVGSARPSATTGAAKTETPSDVSKYEFCCCGLCNVRTGAIIIAVCEILILCHALIFAFTNHFAGEEKYTAYNPTFAAVVKHGYLLPFLIISILWIISNIALMFGAKVLLPALVLPHICVQVVAVLSASLMIGACIVNLSQTEEITWELVLALALFTALILTEVYFVVVMVNCFRYFKHMKVQVASQREILKILADEEEYERKLRRKFSKMPSIDVTPRATPREKAENKLAAE